MYYLYMHYYPNHYTYIVRCSDGTYYTGVTHNLENRVSQHNGILSGGARYTQKRRPVELVYFERFQSRKFAIQRELEIKKLTRHEKEDLIYCRDIINYVS